ncbi:MAG: sulfatase-like hydrolase/transferase [Planctomycetota bacterium]|nr:sulfatase-like hydrolase/transferase [Planctomycetota bacterium]MDA1213916.1 sulfatase-like hydrolase/transferase [Planctomycetota bacterium]
MVRRGSWLIAVLTVFSVCVAWWVLNRSPRRNVLLITLDTTRADRLGCYGHEGALTPVIDRLAQKGVVFERAYAPVPLTLPSHASMLTGLYPPEHGLHNNGQGALPGELPTLATELQSRGYETGAFVAAVVLDHSFGLNRGFTTYDDDLSHVPEMPHSHHRYRSGETVVDSALSWLKRHSSKPFFCWVHLFDPHYPYLTHENRFFDQFADRPYDAEIAYVDQEVGRLLAYLEKAGLDGETIVVVVGDHGESLEEHSERTHGMTVYDATLRVPLIVSAPGISQPGHRVPQAVSLVDLSPTLLECLEQKSLPMVSGRSLYSSLRGVPLSGVTMQYAETDEPYQTAHWSPLQALIDDRWKYIRSPRAELYDLSSDSGELLNLAEKHPELVAKYEARLSEWEQRMGQRSATRVDLTDQDRRSLTSLGYSARNEVRPRGNRTLRDVKDMLPHYNMLDDAVTLMENGSHDEAVPLFEKILAVDDEYFMAHGYLGICLMRQKKMDKAIFHLRRNVELDASADRVRMMLGTALLQNGDFKEAADELRATVRINPNLYQAQYNLGLALEKLGNFDMAATHYRRCLDLVPHFAPARDRLEALESSR